MDQIKIEIAGTVNEDPDYDVGLVFYKRVLGLGWSQVDSMSSLNLEDFAVAEAVPNQLAIDFPDNE